MTLQKKHISLSTLSAILLCAMIVSTILLSGTEGGSTFNFGVTAVFVGVATTTAVVEKRPFLFFPESLFLILWLCYSLLPSMGAQDLDLAYIRMRQMVQIIVIVLLSVNVMIWYGRTAIFAFVFFASAVSAYLTSLAGFGFGVIDEVVLQELNSVDRVVGTHGNANKFGLILLQAQLAALFFGVQAKNLYARLAAALAFVVLAIAVINTGSRTALVGMIIVIFGLVWVFRVWKIRHMVRALLMMGVIGLVGTVTYLSLEESDAVGDRLDSFLENEQVKDRYENLLRLFGSFGDTDAIDNTVEGSASERSRLMEDAWDVAIGAPLGLGLDNFRVHSGLYAHSNYFELLATTGFPGLALYIALYIFMLRRLLAFGKDRSGSNAVVRVFAISVVTLMITDIVNVSYYSKPHWLFVALAIASIELCRRTISTQREPNRQSQTFAYSTH
ncbi:MAG: O-antigen ligase family protein [Chloroflexi bacterium]|nr:O-antigen ligase family protein [Chloroflexota bacterium]